MTKLKTAMIAIDPQYDFHDVPEEFRTIVDYKEDGTPIRVEPALAVTGAWEDAKRLGDFIRKFAQQISRIVVTLDTHQRYDIGHFLYWRDADGNHPDPFTVITHQDVVDGKWTPVDPTLRQHCLDYTKALEDGGKYTHLIWPTHCLVGEPGHNIIRPVMTAIAEWEQKRFTRYMPLTKGHNPHTEHYGGCEAEYPMPNDPTTRLNKRFIESVEENDLVIITGQALSHCVAATVRQIADNFDPENIKKLVLLIDTTNSVPGFEKDGEKFVQEMTARGMQIAKTTDFTVGRDGNLEF